MFGESKDPGQAGVLGKGTLWTGVVGTSDAESGVSAVSEQFVGLWGESHGAGSAGVYGVSNLGPGVVGESKDATQAGVWGEGSAWSGVVGTSVDQSGVSGVSEKFVGIWAESRVPEHAGLFAKGPNNAGFFEGDVIVTGDLQLTGADYAEALDAVDEDIAPGTVVVVGHDGRVHPCGQDYDSAVAGIVSGAGDMKPAIVLDPHAQSVTVAMMGKVWCLADADRSPIRAGPPADHLRHPGPRPPGRPARQGARLGDRQGAHQAGPGRRPGPRPRRAPADRGRGTVMLSTRTEFGHAANSIEVVRSSVGLGRPVSLKQVADAYRQDAVFDEPIVTSDGVALGGHHTLTIHRDEEAYRYTGHFQATGWPSYTAAILTTLSYEVSVPGQPPVQAAVAFAAQGRVHGTDKSGDGPKLLGPVGVEPSASQRVGGGARRGRPHRQLTHDADWFGPAGDVLRFLGQVVVFGATFGGAGVGWCSLVRPPTRSTWNSWSCPAWSASSPPRGRCSCSVREPCSRPSSWVRQPPLRRSSSVTSRSKRRSTSSEVFRVQVPYDRVILTNLLGVGNRPFTMPTPGGPILVNMGDGYDDPTTYTGKGEGATGVQFPGQLLVHELTHAWQIQNESFAPEYLCRSYATAVGTVKAIGGDNSAYKYGPPGGDWSSFGPEQQASIVDDWFGGWGTQVAFAPMDETSPYFRYIRDNIRTGISS